MKKIYLFIVSALLIGTVSASAQRVILRISNNHEVNIDGRNYAYNETVPVLNNGTHTAKLYEVRPGLLGIGKKRTLLSSSNFEIRNNDVIIEGDSHGQLRIHEEGNYNRNGQSSDRNYDRNGSYEKDGKGYGPYNNPGRGHKKGLYKKNKHKKNKQGRDYNDND